jgi:hypothetical protein
MGIDLNLQDENGELIEQVADPQGEFARLIRDFSDESTICLRFIDPYGDTIFNQNQLPVLLEELRKLQSKSGDSSALIATMIDFVKRASGKVHTYCCFSGD